jgi:hypothetical protein
MRTLTVLSLVILAGCSSPPKQSKLVLDQYCYTKQSIETRNGTSISSKTRVECSDDPTDKYIPSKLGYGKECIVSYINMPYGKEKVYACKKYDGTYDVVDSRTIR